jgi:hypothetical protein
VRFFIKITHILKKRKEIKFFPKTYNGISRRKGGQGGCEREEVGRTFFLSLPCIESFGGEEEEEMRAGKRV